MELRPYQRQAIQAINKKFSQNKKRVLLVMATGCGKTIVFANLAKEYVDRGERVLILAHRGELLEQAQDKLKRACGLDSALEKADATAVDSKAPVVVASIQTLGRDNRLKDYPGGSFGLIIIDEAHHSVSNMYQKVLSHFANTKVLGVTATPDRADKKTLAEIYDEVAFEYNMPQAIKDGWLAPIRVKNIPLKVDISKVKTSMGDFNTGDLGHALEPYLKRIASIMQRECQGRKTIVFLPLVDLAKKFTTMLTERGFRAAELDGESTNDARSGTLADFHAGKYNVLCNAMLLTEGFDEPDTDCIVVLRPTKSRSLYAQMVGRGTRRAIKKDYLLLLDFLWLTKKHDLCRPAQLIAPDTKTAERMTRIMQERKEPISLEEALKEALERNLRKNVDRKSRDFFLVDLSRNLGDSELAIYEPTFKWEKEQVTEKQLHFIEALGIKDTKAITTKGLANQIINKLKTRRDNGLASIGQIKYLKGYGFQKVELWTKGEASWMVETICHNHWQVPDNIDPRTCIPKRLRPQTANPLKRKTDGLKKKEVADKNQGEQDKGLKRKIYYLRAKMPLHDLIEQFKKLCKAYKPTNNDAPHIPVLLHSSLENRLFFISKENCFESWKFEQELRRVFGETYFCKCLQGYFNWKNPNIVNSNQVYRWFKTPNEKTKHF